MLDGPVAENLLADGFLSGSRADFSFNPRLSDTQSRWLALARADDVVLRRETILPLS